MYRGFIHTLPRLEAVKDDVYKELNPVGNDPPVAVSYQGGLHLKVAMDATLDDVNLTLDHWVARRCEFTGVWVLDFSESSIALDESLFDVLHTCAGPKAAMCVFVFALVLNPGDVPAMQGLARERANTGTLLSVFTDQNSALRWGQRRWAALSEQRVEERAQAVAQGVAVTLCQVGSLGSLERKPALSYLDR